MLQGDGITIALTGATLIKQGITSTTFAATPDVPFEEFALTLPEGPHSALTTLRLNADLCKMDLGMPTKFVAQDGEMLEQTTHVAVTGCGRPRPRKSKAGKRPAKRRAGRTRH